MRLTHWLGAASVVALLVSGIAILLALPRLFWGETGANAARAWMTLPLPVDLEQTGWGRNLHFLAAWIFVSCGGIYLGVGLLTGHVRRRLWPDRDQIRRGAFAAELRDHLRLRPPAHTHRARYNVMQKMAYLLVVLLLGPVTVLSGLSMSPGVTAAFPELFWLFGGRQSARTIHFFAACATALFLLVHVWQVLINGPGRLLRDMTIGPPRSRMDGTR